MSYDMEMEDYHEDKKLKQELMELADELTREAKKVIQDYKDNPSPQEMSGSYHFISENSPYLLDRNKRVINPDKIIKKK